MLGKLSVCLRRRSAGWTPEAIVALNKAMNTQQQRMQDALIESGWVILAKDTSTLDWWAAETWVVKSNWSPQTCLVYLTFLVDPQWEGEKKANEGIWAVKASTIKPTLWQQQNGEIEMSLGRGWEDRLAEFIQGLTELRSGWAEAQPQPTV